MKKSILFSLIAVGTLSLVSCKKDRVCECTYPSSGGPSNIDKTTYNDATKRQAEANCVSYTVEDGGQIYKVTCELK